MHRLKNIYRSLHLAGAPALVLLYLVVLCGCNTTEGIGKDVEAAGEAVQDAAD